jgi:pimeloyl-ACP methyl ester carboxylesterase
VADGTQDVLTPPANSRTIARRVPGARLTLYPGTGHAFLFQENSRFAGQVDRFLSD